MFHLSAKSEYAVLAVLALALHPRQSPLQAKAIALRERIPLRFLEQVMGLLRRKGIVESVRGPSGGYRLIRPPARIFLGEVIQAVEGPIGAAERAHPRHQEANPETLVLQEIFQEVNAALAGRLNAISFADLCVRKEEKEAQDALMFHI